MFYSYGKKYYRSVATLNILHPNAFTIFNKLYLSNFKNNVQILKKTVSFNMQLKKKSNLVYFYTVDFYDFLLKNTFCYCSLKFLSMKIVEKYL